MLSLFAILLTATCVTLVLTPLVRAAAARIGMVDHPDGRRKLQSAAVPLGGGLAVLGGWLAGLTGGQFWLPGGAPGSGLVILAAGVLVAVGLVDDVRGLTPGVKLCGQIGAVLPLALWGGFPQQYVFAGLAWDLGGGAPLWHLVWLVACINAMNFLDGMDGFAVTIAAIAAASIAVLAGLQAASSAQLMSIAILGGAIGFFPFNRPAASIYLGDAGSMLLGLILGTSASLAATSVEGTCRWLVPIALLALPLWDAALAIARRLLARRSIATPDRGHLHHRLMQRGITGVAALRLVGLLGLACGVVAAASIFGHDLAALTAIAVLGLILTLGRVVGNREAAGVLTRLAALSSHLAHRLSDPRRRAVASKNRILVREMEQLCDQFGLSRLSLAIRQHERQVFAERVDRARETPVSPVPPFGSPQWLLTIQAERDPSYRCAVTAGFTASAWNFVDDPQLIEQLSLLAKAGAGLTSGGLSPERTSVPPRVRSSPQTDPLVRRAA